MEARVVPEADMLGFKGNIPQDMAVTYIKLISIGPNSLKEVSGDPARLKEKCASIQGFFLITKSGETEDTLRKLVSKFVEKL